MKRISYLIITLILILGFSLGVYADSKITALSEDTAPTSDDVVLSVDITSGVNKKVTATNLIKKAHGLSDGLVKVASGTMGTASDGTDYLSPTVDETITGNWTIDHDDATAGLTVRVDNAGSAASKGIVVTTDDQGETSNYKPLEIRDDSGVADALLFSINGVGSVISTANIAGATYGSNGGVSDAELLYINTLSSNAQDQLDARALESVVGTSLNADDLELNGAVLQTAAEIPHIDAIETVSAAWTFEGQRITVKTAAPTDPLPGWEGWADSDTWDPTGQGLSVPVKVTLTRDTTELFDDSENQDFTAGGGQWADGDLGTTFDSTTDLSLASDAAAQYCELAVAEAPTTIGKRYRLTYDLDTLTGSWIIKDFTGAQTIGTISATATQGYLDWIATTTGGFRIVSGATVSIGNFDNFTLNALPYKAIRDQEGNVYFATIQAAMKVNTDPNDISLTAAQMNAVIVITGAGEVTIPDGECDTATGQWITVKQTGAYAVDISFSGTDVGYLVDGTEVEGTNEIQTAGASGNQVTLMCIVAKQWWVTGEIGTSTEEAAD